MQVTETLNEGLRRGYAIKVPAGELDAKVNEKLEEARKDFQMKGFRKGKAPAALMKKMFGKSVLGEAMQETIDEAMRGHFEASGDRPAGQPEVKMTNEKWSEGEDIEVAMTYEALPDVPDVDLASVKLERLVAEIDDAAVTEALENLAASANTFSDRRKGSKAKDGDQVVMDFKGSIDGVEFEGGSAEDFPLVLGSGSFIPGFEEQIVGAKAGDEIEAKVTFPDDYGAANLAGKEAVFACTIKSVMAPKPAEIDDELAKRYGADDLDALKEQIRGRLGDEYGQASRAIMKRRLMDALDGMVGFELPPSLVEVEAKQIAHQLWHEDNPDHQGHDHPEVVADGGTRETRRAARAARPAARGARQPQRDRGLGSGDAAGGLRAGAAIPRPGTPVPRIRPEEPPGPPADPRASLRGQGRRLHRRAGGRDRTDREQGRAAEGDRGARRGRGADAIRRGLRVPAAAGTGRTDAGPFATDRAIPGRRSRPCGRRSGMTIPLVEVPGRPGAGRQRRIQ